MKRAVGLPGIVGGPAVVNGLEDEDTHSNAQGAMPAGVGVPHRVVAHVRIPVQALRIPRLRHQRVRLDEAPYRRVVVAGVVVVQLDDPIPPLTGEAIGQEDAPRAGTDCPVEIRPNPIANTKALIQNA